MSYSPVIPEDSLMIVARCPQCRGSALCVLEQFVSAEDRNTARELVMKGFTLQKIAVSKVKSMESCECKPGTGAAE